jgi:hypothetical protein
VVFVAAGGRGGAVEAARDDGGTTWGVGGVADGAVAESCYVYVWKVRGLEIKVDEERIASMGEGERMKYESLKRIEGGGGNEKKFVKLIVVMYGKSGGPSGDRQRGLEEVRARLQNEAKAYNSLLGTSPRILWDRANFDEGALEDLGAIIFEHNRKRFQQAEWLEKVIPTLLGVPLPPSIIYHFERIWCEVEISKELKWTPRAEA